MTGFEVSGSRPSSALDAELIAIAAATASDAGATPAEALTLALKVSQSFASSALVDELERAALQLRLAPNQRVEAERMVVQPLVGELLRLVLESERNGDNLRVKLDLHLRAAFERRETLLKRRIETVPVYMIVVLVLFFMPAILLVLTGPSFLALLRALYAT
jgi:tight adherence protein C